MRSENYLKLKQITMLSSTSVGKKPDFREFHAHSVLLCCRSLHFNETLSAKDIEKKGGKYVIKKPGITPQAFDVIIK